MLLPDEGTPLQPLQVFGLLLVAEGGAVGRVDRQGQLGADLGDVGDAAVEVAVAAPEINRE